MNPETPPPIGSPKGSSESAAVELAVVMPVYNEEACILPVLLSWHEELTRLGIDFRIIALNDGSRDSTGAILDTFKHHPRVEIIHKPNSGHGPTILQGYARAVRAAQWVFQTDSDDEMKPRHFAGLWNLRESYDALFGIRQDRLQPLSRKFITQASRLAVRLLFGKGVIDVNVPFRLIRSSRLDPMLERIPRDSVTPNILISGALAMSSLRILNRPVPCEGRQTGVVSVKKWKLLKMAMLSFWETVQFRQTSHRASASG